MVSLDLAGSPAILEVLSYEVNKKSEKKDLKDHDVIAA